jgi:hypothetical protein
MQRPHVIVDAMNVIGSRPNGWWRDRGRAVRHLVKRLQHLALADEVDLTVGIDGQPLKDLPEGMQDGLQLLYATRHGPNAADDRILDFIRAHEHPASLSLITSDRKLRESAESIGAQVGSPRMLLDRLDELDREPSKASMA